MGEHLSTVDPKVLALTWPGGNWQNSAKVVAAMLITYVIVLWISAVIWTFRDIHDRTRDPFFQAVSVFVVLVFNLPGLWLYLSCARRRRSPRRMRGRSRKKRCCRSWRIRRPAQTAAGGSRRTFLSAQPVRRSSKRPCEVCSRPLAYSWTACPYCGTAKHARPQRRRLGNQQTATMPRRPHSAAYSDGEPTLAPEGSETG